MSSSTPPEIPYEMGMKKGSLDLHKLGEKAWSRVEKINCELFTLTYGAFLVHMLKNTDNITELNHQLEKIGYNIGIRLIDDFLATSNITACPSFAATAGMIAHVAFKMFLGVAVRVSHFDELQNEFTLAIDDNPLTYFVDVPECYRSQLDYCNVLCGVIRGALEMVNMIVECNFAKDSLKGDSLTEIRVKLIEIVKDKLEED